jgi:hypothetical protein
MRGRVGGGVRRTRVSTTWTGRFTMLPATTAKKARIGLDGGEAQEAAHPEDQEGHEEQEDQERRQEEQAHREVDEVASGSRPRRHI